MKEKRHIIAIGGGGFSSPPIARYFVRQANRENPRALLIPTASGDALKTTVDFYKTFSDLDCRPKHLHLFDPPSSDLESYVLENDLIYVGGGNTKNMLALWREWGLDQILRKAWDKGIVLGGSSAGALCWFEEGVTDSIPGPLTKIQCLGFLKGSFCPHYDGEIERRPAFHRLIKSGMKGGVAADDFVAFHYEGTSLKSVIRAKDGHHGWTVCMQNGNLEEEKIVPTDLYG